MVAIERSGSKLDRRVLDIEWVGATKRLMGEGNMGVSVAEETIRNQGIGERVSGEQENFGASDREAIKINKAVRNE